MKSSIEPLNHKNLQQASLDLFPIEPYRNNREKRATPRQRLSLPLEVSYINKEERSNARLINYCAGGMCIRSRTRYKPGMSLVVRVKCYQSDNADIDFCEGPRSINLADVKWCEKIMDDERSFYKVGLQLFAPEY